MLFDGNKLFYHAIFIPMIDSACYKQLLLGMIGCFEVVIMVVPL